MTPSPLSPPRRAWPVLLALGLVALLVSATVGTAVVVAQRVARRTTEMVEDSQRSVELVDDLRAQAHRLLTSTQSHADLLAVTGRIADDARAYDPIAVAPGEHEEWLKLQDALGRLQQSVARPGSPRARSFAREIGRSIDRLVVINRASAHAEAEAIRRLNRRAVEIDGAVAGLALLLAAAVALTLSRTLGRERTLIERHIALLDARNRELDAFASRAAHDLRVPLNPIRGYADLLRAGEEPPAEVHDMASKIRIAVDRMNSVIDNMLELSRVGRPQPGSCSPAAVVREVLEEMAPQLTGVEVSSEIPDAPVGCTGSLLAQILRGLLDNALKFRDRGRKLRIRISALPGDDAVALAVEDNGIGMDDEGLRHAFEPFYRGVADREVPGHGLGLAIVHRAATALGGTCAIERGTDRGVRITVRLPKG